MTILGVIEHVFLVLPLAFAALWRWSPVPHAAEGDPTAGRPARHDRPSSRSRGSVM